MIWSMRGAWDDRRGVVNLLDGAAPFYDTYRCADGRFVAVGALEPAFYAELLDGLGLDPRDLPDRDDRAGWPLLRSRLAEVFATHDRDHWDAVFRDRDACVTPVLNWDEATRDDHLTEQHPWRLCEPLPALTHESGSTRGPCEQRRSPGHDRVADCEGFEPPEDGLATPRGEGHSRSRPNEVRHRGRTTAEVAPIPRLALLPVGGDHVVRAALQG
jgi:CoA-transferase family III